MQSKTLSSEFTILRKDLTRFAPAWLSLSAYLTIWASTIMVSGETFGDFYEPVAPIFAPILALVVFGYLCDPKECNMLHSLPIRRERLFIIHVAAAMLMFLVPTGIFCVLTGPFATQGIFYRFIFMGLEFFFLFSIGVLCMMFTGRKIGAALLYLFIQCLSFIAGAIIENLFLPLLPGVYIDPDYYFMSPMLVVSSYADFMTETTFPRDAWSFIAVIGGVALAVLAISMVLYRRRKLEHAGDLLAVRWLDPFFAACSGLTGASAMVVFGYDTAFFQLILGMAIGYFSYWMLSKKSARVFNLKILGGYAALLAAVLGSMYLVRLDPLDRVAYVPEPAKVDSVKLAQGRYDSGALVTYDPELIAGLCELHQDATEKHMDSTISGYDPGAIYTIHFTYFLENGSCIQREYDLQDEAVLKRAGWYLSQPEAQFQRKKLDILTVSIRHDGAAVYLDPRLIPELEQVLIEDSLAGRMFGFDYNISSWSMNIEQQNPEQHTYKSIPATATSTVAWLEEHCVVID